MKGNVAQIDAVKVVAGRRTPRREFAVEYKYDRKGRPIPKVKEIK